jgi:hypothetical protein
MAIRIPVLSALLATLVAAAPADASTSAQSKARMDARAFASATRRFEKAEPAYVARFTNVLETAQSCAGMGALSGTQRSSALGFAAMLGDMSGIGTQVSAHRRLTSTLAKVHTGDKTLRAAVRAMHTVTGLYTRYRGFRPNVCVVLGRFAATGFDPRARVDIGVGDWTGYQMQQEQLADDAIRRAGLQLIWLGQRPSVAQRFVDAASFGFAGEL